jgi:3-hydroxyisobutyrate dehydrogenase-like beta-hydroxyacid dehydrogenase
VSPGTKIKTNKIIKFSGASYYDLAIMAPIHPLGHKTKMLVAGPNKTKINKILKKLKFNYEWENTEIGKAAVIKMLRSIMIKGVESLLTECVTASEKIGIHDRILLSAEKTLGIKNIKKLADYFMERSALHGLRRSDEMNEVVKTLKEMKLSSHMSKAISNHQKMIGKLKLKKKFKNKIPQNRIKIARAIRKI